jgi:TnpA family transposase
VKHAVALKLGMADVESLLRRFSRNNNQHPAYKALAELERPLRPSSGKTFNNTIANLKFLA